MNATAPSIVFMILGGSPLRSAVIKRVYIAPNGTVSNFTDSPGCAGAHASICFWITVACAAVVRLVQTLSSTEAAGADAAVSHPKASAPVAATQRLVSTIVTSPLRTG